MATVIDELVVVLGLNANPMIAGQQKAVQALQGFISNLTHQARTAQAQSSGMAASFGKIRLGMLGIAGVAAAAAGALVELEKRFAETDSKLSQTAYRLGISAKELGGWQSAAKAAGGSAEGVTAAFTNLQDAMSEMKFTGVPFEGLKWLNFLNIGLKDVQGNMKKTPEIFSQMADKMKQDGRSIEDQTIILRHVFGAQADDLVRIVQAAGRAGVSVKAYTAHMDELGGRTTAAIDRHQKLMDRWNEMGVRAEGLGRKMEEALAPVFDWINAKLEAALAEFTKFFDDVAKKGFEKAAGIERTKEGDIKIFEEGGAADWFWKNVWVPGLKAIDNTLGIGSAGGSVMQPGASLGGPQGGPRAFVGGASMQNPAGLPTGRLGPLPANAGQMKAWAMDQARKEGISEEHVDAAASLMLAQAMAESGLNPRAVHDQGTGYGIYGARLDRRDDMLKWEKENNFPPDSPEGQIRYMMHEPFTNPRRFGPTINALRNATKANATQLSPIVMRNFENPAGNYGRQNETLRALMTGIPSAQIPNVSTGAVGGAVNSSTIDNSSTTTDQSKRSSINIQNMNVATNDAKDFSQNLSKIAEAQSFSGQANAGIN